MIESPQIKKSTPPDEKTADGLMRLTAAGSGGACESEATLVYRVRNWRKHFESHESRKLKSALSWFRFPTGHDQLSYRRLIKHDRAASIYGAWGVILGVAAKCPERGTLANSDGPMTAADLHDMTGFPVDAISLAFDVLCLPEIHWLEHVEWEPFGDDSQEESPGPRRAAPGPRRAPPDREDETRREKTRVEKTRDKPPCFLTKVSEEDLKDTDRLLALLLKHGGPGADDHENQLRILGAALYATRTKSVQSPIKAFVSLVTGRKWEWISEAHRVIAKQQLSARANQRRPTDAPGGTLARNLACPDVETAV